MKSLLEKPWIFFVLVVAGVFVAWIIVKLQPDLVHEAKERAIVPVSYIEVKSHSIKPEITGFGTVKPDKSLRALAEVSGRVEYLHPDLKKGEIFAKDTVLLRIDNKDYLLQLRQAEADVVANQANLAEVHLMIENNELELKLAKQKLLVRKTEYQRLEKLHKSGAVSQSKLDAERQVLLQQEQEVQQLRNKKTTLPSDLKVIQAQLAIAEAKKEKSQRDLDRTEVRLPFNGRISEVSVETDQFVALGASLFKASALNKIVINAQFSIDQFRQFSKSFNQSGFNFSDPSVLSNMVETLDRLGLSAKVELASNSPSNDAVIWNAKVERFSDDLDPLSRTVGVTVSVSGSYENIEPGKRPPLLEGMYMKVRLLGKTGEYQVIPRFTIHGKEVFTIDQNNQLIRKKVPAAFNNDELALFSTDLAPGEKIITSDPFPVIEGMKVAPKLDVEVERQIVVWLEMQ